MTYQGLIGTDRRQIFGQLFDPVNILRFRMLRGEEQRGLNQLINVDEIKTLSDGSKYYTAEQFITGTKVERSGNQVTYSTIFLYNDVYVIRLKSDNSIDNIEKISKRQYSLTTARYNSFIDFEKNGTLYFIYNTIKKEDTMFKNAEIGETYISKINKSVATKVYKTPASNKVPIIIPATQLELPNKSVMYAMMSVNFKDYKFELIDVE